IPDQVTEIGIRAFAFCNSLTDITIPAGVTRIDDEAFLRSDSVTAEVANGSYAQKYCKKNGIRYNGSGKETGGGGKPDTTLIIALVLFFLFPMTGFLKAYLSKKRKEKQKRADITRKLNKARREREERMANRKKIDDT
ncbi:MAG: leucine-rich repeat protein, partial [Oscillospiraceae bacterium]|nr:leucine-rich repeat protein [Oscillospiraceae bacterium]